MCRLLGIIANKPVDIEYSFSKFQNYSVKNSDGWGIGWYEKGLPFVEKDPSTAESHSYKKDIKSQVFISHLRKATEGKKIQSNCHPFQEGNWIFAHNGSINRDVLLEMVDSLKKDHWGHEWNIKGDTDSEVFFYWILQNIHKNIDKPIEGIKEALQKTQAIDHTSRNFILSDGSTMYAYCDYTDNPQYYSLSYLVRDPATFEDGTSVEVNKLLMSKRLHSEKAVIICSERLGDESREGPGTKPRDEVWKETGEERLLVVSKKLDIKKYKVM